MASHGAGLWRLPIAFAFALGYVSGCARESPESAPSPDTVRVEVHTPPRDHLIRDWQIEDLERAGLKDPVPRLVRDLASHPELIPFPGVLGGTMGFYDSTQIPVLNDRWVYAYFEDGHISGYGLFEYSVASNGRIRWKRVSAYLDE